MATDKGTPPIGVLLVNLGTPDSPSVRDVRRFLREFLGDPRVIDLHPVARWLLLNLIILPFRPRSSAAAYRSIWTDGGSPLLRSSVGLRDALAARLGGGFVVALGMRYGRPSIDSAVEALGASGVSSIVIVPLFPQYASSSSGSAIEAALGSVGRRLNVPAVCTVPAFFDDPGFVEALAEVSREPLRDFRPDHVLMSYHGLPERQVRAADPSGAHCLARKDCCTGISGANRFCYRAHCFATSRALASRLSLEPGSFTVTFQSRLGRSPWIGPHTDSTLAELPARGVRRVAVLCPSFVADCLETLEEIGIRGREQFLGAGGQSLLLVPCVNAHPRWVDALASLVRTPGPA